MALQILIWRIKSQKWCVIDVWLALQDLENNLIWKICFMGLSGQAVRGALSRANLHTRLNWVGVRH